MINQAYTGMLSEKDIIFEIFQYSLEKAKEVGPENIYDFSLGNPSVPAPDSVNETISELLASADPLTLHGYSPSFGIMEVRQSIADSLNQNFNCHYQASDIFMTIGAAGALAHALRAVTNPGDSLNGRCGEKGYYYLKSLEADDHRHTPLSVGGYIFYGNAFIGGVIGYHTEKRGQIDNQFDYKSQDKQH